MILEEVAYLYVISLLSHRYDLAQSSLGLSLVIDVTEHEGTRIGGSKMHILHTKYAKNTSHFTLIMKAHVPSYVSKPNPR